MEFLIRGATEFGEPGVYLSFEEKTEELTKNLQYRIVWPDGSLHWIETKGVFLDDCEGKDCRLLGVVFDITERKMSEEKLRINAEEMKSLNEELYLFNKVAVGRELRMIELKKEINELCAQTGQPPRYPLEFLKE